MQSNKIHVETDQHDLTQEEINRSVETYKKELTKAIGEAEKGLDKFKLLLSPIRLLKNPISDDEYALLMDYFKAKCGEIICNAISSEIDCYTLLVRNEKFLDTRLEKLLAVKEAANIVKYSVKFNAGHDLAINSIAKNGFEAYRIWLRENLNKINKLKETDHFNITVDCYSNELFFTKKMKEQLTTLFNLTISDTLKKHDWSVIYELSATQLSRVEDQIIIYLAHMKAVILNKLLATDSLAQFESNLTAQRASFNKVVNDYRDHYKRKVKSPVPSFGDFANQWFEVQAEIFSPDKKVSVKKIARELVVQRNISPWMLSEEDINDLYIQISKITKTGAKEKFYIALESHFVNNKIKHVIDSEAALAIDSATKTNKSGITTLKDEIPSPLSWQNLSISLEHLACRTELQFKLKQYLNAYILKQVKANTDLNNSILERRHAEYLISCLFLASKKQVDEDILFNKSAREALTAVTVENAIGMTLVLQETDTGLKKGIAGLFQSLKERNILYLRLKTNHPVSLINEIEKKQDKSKELTSSENYQLYFKSYNTFLDENNNPNTKLNELNQACYYLTKAAIGGIERAFGKFVTTPPKIILSNDLVNVTNNEFFARLQQFLTPDSPLYSDPRFCLCS